MNDWSRLLRSPNSVRRHFNSGAPPLAGLRLLRVVFGPGAIRLAFGFRGIPAGATDKWRRSGYTAVDLILRLSRPTVERVDWAALLVEQADVSVDLNQDRVVVKNAVGPVLVASVEYLDAEFVPDPVMQKAMAYRDESGTDLEPTSFSGDGNE